MNVLVTGGSGYIGTFVMKYLLERGANPVCFDLAPPKNLPPEYVARVKYVRGSIADWEEIMAVIQTEKIDRIIHLVSMMSADCQRYPKQAIQVGVGGTLNILEAARLLGIQRVVYASSASVYGHVEGEYLRETANRNPISVYGLTKLTVEHLLESYLENYGLDYIALRPSHGYGPGRERGYTKDVTMIKNAVAGLPTRIEGASHTHELVYVKDCARAFAMAALAEQHKFKHYNIGIGRRLSMMEIAGIVKSIIPEAQIEMVEGYDFTGSDRTRTIQPPMDISRAAEDLGWTPEYSPEKGISELIEWFRTTLNKS